MNTTTKFSAENKKAVHDILNYYDPCDVMNCFTYGEQNNIIYDEYRGYINKIIRASDYNVSHNTMWDICMKLFEFEEDDFDKTQRVIMYEMVEELCKVFAK